MTASTSFGAGVFASRSETSSIAYIAPRPRTAPMHSCRSAIAVKRRRSVSPIAVALASRPSRSLTSIEASAVAHATGWPPNVGPAVGERPVRIWVRHVRDVRAGRAHEWEARVLRLARRGHRGVGAAVERVLERDDPLAAGGDARDLQRVLHGLSPAVEEHGLG